MWLLDEYQRRFIQIVNRIGIIKIVYLVLWGENLWRRCLVINIQNKIIGIRISSMVSGIDLVFGLNINFLLKMNFCKIE